MNIETIKRFISEEYKAPVSRFPWFGIGIFLILIAPIWPFVTLLHPLPAYEDLIMRSGIISSLSTPKSKESCDTRVLLNTNTGQISFCVKFCGPFPSGLSEGQYISAWLDPDQYGAWQIHEGNRVVCSYQNSAYALASGIQRLPLITAIQAVLGLFLTAIAFVLWRSRCKKALTHPPGTSTRKRRKRRSG